MGAGGKRRILLMEPGDELRATLTRAMEHAGYAVTQAACPERGYTFVADAVNARAPFDALVLSLDCPRASAADWMPESIVNNLRLKHIGTPALLYSADHQLIREICTTVISPVGFMALETVDDAVSLNPILTWLRTALVPASAHLEV